MDWKLLQLVTMFGQLRMTHQPNDHVLEEIRKCIYEKGLTMGEENHRALFRDFMKCFIG